MAIDEAEIIRLHQRAEAAEHQLAAEREERARLIDGIGLELTRARGDRDMAVARAEAAERALDEALRDLKRMWQERDVALAAQQAAEAEVERKAAAMTNHPIEMVVPRCDSREGAEGGAMNADEQAAWSDAVFDANYLDMEVPEQLVPKFAILAADTEFRALRAVAEAARLYLQWQQAAWSDAVFDANYLAADDLDTEATDRMSRRPDGEVLARIDELMGKARNHRIQGSSVWTKRGDEYMSAARVLENHARILRWTMGEEDPNFGATEARENDGGD